MILIALLDLSHKVHTNWYMTLLCSSKIYKIKPGHLFRAPHYPWEVLFRPWNMSKSNFDHTIDFYLNNISGHLSGSLPDPWGIFLVPKLMSISDFDYTIGFVAQSTYKLIFHTFLLYKKLQKNSSHHSGTLPDTWRSSWQQGWCP